MRWPPLKSLHELVQAHRLRQMAPTPKPPMLKRRWAWLGVGTSQVESLKDLAASGKRLESLLQHPGWTDVMAAKAYYQRVYDLRLKDTTPGPVADQQRFGAACEWRAVEGLFVELRERIKRGDTARQKLEQLLRVPKP